MKLKKILVFLIIFLMSIACLQITACKKEDKIAPEITVSNYDGVYYINTEISILQAIANDDIDGTVNVEISILSPLDFTISINNNKFIPETLGTFKIIYSATDAAGNKVEIIKEIEIIEPDRNAPEITIENYDKNVYFGSNIIIPSAIVTDDKETDIIANITVKSPLNENVEIENNSFFAEFCGTYTVIYTAKNNANLTSTKNTTFNILYKKPIKNGIDGMLNDEIYNSSKVFITKFSGQRDLEEISLKGVRDEDGIYFAFESKEDKKVSSNERIELFISTDGLSVIPTTNTFNFYLSPDDGIVAAKGNNDVSSWKNYDLKTISYNNSPVYSAFLNEGTTIAAGNIDDNGWSSELFIPYSYLGISSNDIFYMSLGAVREGDIKNWDGWNEWNSFPDPQLPYKYISVNIDGTLTEREINIYQSTDTDINASLNQDRYSSEKTAITSYAGLRNLEGAKVFFYNGEEGLYATFLIANDIKVNSLDRIELFLYAGSYSDEIDTNNLAFWISANGTMQVRKANISNKWEEFVPALAMPKIAIKYGTGTTLNNNSDIDSGWSTEIFIPYSLFEIYTGQTVDSDTRLGLSMGIVRSSDNIEKDWDGFSFGGYCDPIIPSAYAVLMSDGRIVTRSSVIDQLQPATDEDIDGLLNEEYWQSQTIANLSIQGDSILEKPEANMKIYRDVNGLRIGINVLDNQIDYNDQIILCISGADGYYTIGDEGTLNDSYTLLNKYPNANDYLFYIQLDRSVQVFRGQFKDWAIEIQDLSSLQLEIIKSEDGYIAELYIPYTFLSTESNTFSKDIIFGTTYRISSANSKGSKVWSKYEIGGVIAETETPSKYARVTVDGKVYASLDNSGDYKIDGDFDEEFWNSDSASISFTQQQTNIKVVRTEKGVYLKVEFGSDTESIQYVLSTYNHGLENPYVYDYQIILHSSGQLEYSWGNSKDWYLPELYIPYSAPRAVLQTIDDMLTAEIFIPYSYISWYSTSGNYMPIGYFEPDITSNLKFAASITVGEAKINEFVYNDLLISGIDTSLPSTYIDLILNSSLGGNNNV